MILANGKTGSSIWARTRYAVKPPPGVKVNSSCYEFSWNSYFSTPDPNDLQYLEYVYLALCIFSILRLPYEMLNIVAVAGKRKYPQMSEFILSKIQQPFDDCVILTRKKSKFFDYFLRYPRATYLMFYVLFGVPPIIVSVILCGVLDENAETWLMLISGAGGTLVIVLILILNYSTAFWRQENNFRKTLWKNATRRVSLMSSAVGGFTQQTRAVGASNEQMSTGTTLVDETDTVCKHCNKGLNEDISSSVLKKVRNSIHEEKVRKSMHEVCESAPIKIKPDWVKINIGLIKVKFAARPRPGITWHATNEKSGLTCNNVSCMFFYVFTIGMLGVFVFLTTFYGLKLPKLDNNNPIDYFKVNVDENCENCFIDVTSYNQIGCVDWESVLKHRKDAGRPENLNQAAKCLPKFSGEFSLSKFDKMCTIEFQNPVNHFRLLNSDDDEGFAPADFELLETDSNTIFTVYSPSLMKSPHALDISKTLRYEGFYAHKSGFNDDSSVLGN